MKSYDPFTYSLMMKDHQAISPGETIDDNGVKIKVLDIQKVDRIDDHVVVTMTVRELPERGDR